MEPRFTEAAPRRGRRANLTPMVDVLFLLVVFFLLAARFGAEGALALTSGGPGAGGWEGPPRLVTVLPDGATLNGVPMADAALAGALAPLMPAPGAPVVVRAVEGADLQRLVDVVEALAAGGIAKVLIAE